MTGLRKCGTGWAYCDGYCGRCFRVSTTYTTSTTDNRIVTPYGNVNPNWLMWHLTEGKYK